MRRITGYKLVPAIIITILLLAPIIPFGAQSKGAQGRNGAIIFDIELYDEKGRKFSNILGMSSIPKDLDVYAQVFAITSPDNQKIIDEVYRGKIVGLRLRLEARGKLKEIAEEWIKFEERRGPVSRDRETAVQLNLFIVNKTSNELVQLVSYYYTYSPKGLIKGEERVHKVKVVVPKKGRGGESRSSIYEKVEPQDVIGCPSPTYWKPIYKVVPENYTSGYGSYIRYHNGAWYIQIPVLAIYNRLYLSSPIDSYIQIIGGRIYASIGIGVNIEKKLRGGDVTGGLSGEVYRGGITIEEEKLRFIGDLEDVNAWEEAYAWIWARPVFIFYKLYYVDCSGYEYPLDDEKVDFFVQDYIKEYDSQLGVYRIVGGVTKGSLPSFIRKWIYNDTLSYTIDTKVRLDASSSIWIEHLISTCIDTCKADFEMPLGIVLSVAMKAFPATAPFASLAVMIPVTLSWGESETIYVHGSLVNLGPYPEYLYLRMSKLQYRKDPPWWCFWCSPCYYDVPVSMYIISD